MQRQMHNKVEAVKKVDFFIASIWHIVKIRQYFLCVLAVNINHYNNDIRIQGRHANNIIISTLKKVYHFLLLYIAVPITTVTGIVIINPMLPAIALIISVAIESRLIISINLILYTMNKIIKCRVVPT